ncbi:TetR/AcrR family transcriptional regulator [Nonomuraea maheshkhaliensis]|uniref:TetR/AcrR family transcriptional regulator n=2 Tax=Nonomuraea maheshkhaliensis TaxID=419590 RepID=A0ABN2HIC4_9ACTN
MHGRFVKNECSFYCERMPKVSDEHLEMRRDQILEAARACFARKGFHQSSMQDVIKESALSAGAIYRYFKSKDDIIAALATRTSGSLERLLERITAQDPLPPLEEVLGQYAEAVIANAGPDGPIRLAPHAWSAALTSPELLDTTKQPTASLRAHLVKLAERMQREGRLPADADPRAVGATLLCFLPGFLIQHLLLGDIDALTLRSGLHALLAPGT